MSSDNEQQLPTEAELAEMDRDQLVTLGGKLDGVELVEYPDPWPVGGTRAEKRAERTVALWFTIAGVAGLAFLVAMIWWPWEYEPFQNSDGHFWYSLYTPVLGVTLGVSVLAFAIGTLVYTKKFIPHEVAVQQRNDNLGAGSDEVHRQTFAAHVADAGSRSTIARRSAIKRSAGLGIGMLGLGATILPLVGFIRNPHAESGTKDGLYHSGWQAEEPGQKVFVRRYTGKPHEIVLVRPEDLEAGSMETVFPFKESERGDSHALSAALKRVDNPVMLIRLRPDDAAKVVKRKGQENFNYGDFYAYTKICSHVGCPTSLFEQRTNRILCPCHQSQFDALHYAKPIFGPATRALAQLPITVDPETGYLIAKSDFIEPVGPGFWERKS
ncbi:MAG: Rieske 2Fe-2S domain-containing protein [Actinophytocola sp.]|nr:Rieske 2Fe-2S domain-containing protein [Actinophytocola sp.]